MTREEALQWLTNEKWKNANNKYKKEWNEAFDLAIEALSADAAQGEWIYDHHNDEHTCSVCGRKALCDDYVGIDWQMEVLSDFCPSCGARMKGGDSE